MNATAVATGIATTDNQTGLASSIPGFRDLVLEAQTYISQFDQVECPLQHTFAPGSYARSIRLPEGSLIIGKIHKHAHLNIVSKGRITVITEFGRREIDASEAPVIFTSDAGSKRALYCHTESFWTTIHLTDKTDLAEIEREIIAQDYVELDQFMARNCVEFIEGLSVSKPTLRVIP